MAALRCTGPDVRDQGVNPLVFACSVVPDGARGRAAGYSWSATRSNTFADFRWRRRPGKLTATGGWGIA
jgi:hypothetical protein